MIAIDTSNGDAESPLSTLFSFGGPEPVELPSGIWKVKFIIEDKWGAITEHIIQDEIIVRQRIIGKIIVIYSYIL